jgi:O-methyltransferase
MSRLRQLAKTSFVNTVGRLAYSGSIVDKLACWIRFSRWCVERGALLGRYDARANDHYEDRYKLYEAVIRKERLEQEPFDFVEFGVYEGASIAWWAKRISHPDTRFFGFDTFTGLPEQWGRYGAKTFSTGGKIPEITDSRCKFEPGLFQDTVPAFLRGYSRHGRLVVHLDADLYSSTLYALTALAMILKRGDLLFFDEFGTPVDEFRAFEDFMRAYMLSYEVMGAANNFNRVCLKLAQVSRPVDDTVVPKRTKGAVAGSR